MTSEGVAILCALAGIEAACDQLNAEHHHSFVKTGVGVGRDPYEAMAKGGTYAALRAEAVRRNLLPAEEDR